MQSGHDPGLVLLTRSTSYAGIYAKRNQTGPHNYMVFMNGALRRQRAGEIMSVIHPGQQADDDNDPALSSLWVRIEIHVDIV